MQCDIIMNRMQELPTTDMDKTDEANELIECNCAQLNRSSVWKFLIGSRCRERGVRRISDSGSNSGETNDCQKPPVGRMISVMDCHQPAPVPYFQAELGSSFSNGTRPWPMIRTIAISQDFPIINCTHSIIF